MIDITWDERKPNNGYSHYFNKPSNDQDEPENAFFRGYMDELRISKTARYVTNFIPCPSLLSRIWKKLKNTAEKWFSKKSDTVHGNFTIEFWFYKNYDENQNHYMSLCKTSCGGIGIAGNMGPSFSNNVGSLNSLGNYDIKLNNYNNRISIWHYDNPLFEATAIVLCENWNHIALTKLGKNVVLYLNGSLIGSEILDGVWQDLQ